MSNTVVLNTDLLNIGSTIMCNIAMLIASPAAFAASIEAYVPELAEAGSDVEIAATADCNSTAALFLALSAG